MYETHDKLDIADEMLDSAIQSLIESKHFFVALNLACVAEELYGQHIRLCGGQNSQSGLIQLAEVIARADGDVNTTQKELWNASVALKNSIKHLDSQEDRYIEADITKEAISAIYLALANHQKLSRKFTPNIQRFIEFSAQPTTNCG